jgi:hypothetical protein
VQVAACREDEEGAPQRRVALLVSEWDVLPCDVREDDELELVSRSGTRLRSSPA